jgi:hypothetical protein
MQELSTGAPLSLAQLMIFAERMDAVKVNF